MSARSTSSLLGVVLNAGSFLTSLHAIDSISVVRLQFRYGEV